MILGQELTKTNQYSAINRKIDVNDNIGYKNDVLPTILLLFGIIDNSWDETFRR